ncbi:hypothetical protein QR680_002876 [Steinernema hermaphroditum]|uniref:Fumarylacetoacetase-like C-terminal domain-containing protein n=1 Tax=Steinernema hermaphroditum TaxID=289476 RepID=A0AA39LJ76_9BILA|nr:hypothetical protein QR680_002876 [Steinernema hermaphroditum]
MYLTLINGLSRTRIRSRNALHSTTLISDSMAANLSIFCTIGTKIVCVAHNYVDHAKELGNVIPKKPMIFFKVTEQLGAQWFLAKSFDTSCPVSKSIEKSKIPAPHKIEIYCLINEKG